MIVIVVAAILLAAFIQVVGWRRRQAWIEQLRAEIELNQIAQAEAKVMAEQARRQHETPREAQGYEETVVGLQEEGQELRQRLSRLQQP
jgi:hypothetical protein